VPVFLRQQVLLQRLEFVDVDAQGRARRAVAVVPRQVQHARIARHLHVQRRVRFEAMFEVDAKAQEADVELARAVLVEHA
jgi:hypothetical protein